MNRFLICQMCLKPVTSISHVSANLGTDRRLSPLRMVLSLVQVWIENGLRPARYKVTEDGTVVMGSEVGIIELDDSRVVEKGRLGPGQMIAVDTAQGKLLKDSEIKHRVC